MQKLKAEKDAGTLKGFSIDLQVGRGDSLAVRTRR